MAVLLFGGVDGGRDQRASQDVMPAAEKVLGRESGCMVISCDAKMTRLDTQFDYVGGNGSCEIRMVGFPP
jgi:hypothetical protein